MHGIDKRDQAVEQLLRRTRASSPDAGVTPACLDAETMAAWMDGRLSGAALDVAQMHAADCDRCQAVLATFAQVNTPMPTPAPASRRWFVWFVPAGAVAALLVWALLPRVSQSSGVLPDGTMARNDASATVQPEATPERAQAPAGAEPLTPPQGVTQGRNDRPATQSFAAPAPGSTEQPSSSALKQGQLAEHVEVDSLQQREKAAADNATAAAPAPPPPSADAFPTARTLQAVAVRWRVAGARVERSLDGVDWTAIYTNPTPLTAVAAPSATVVWAVGQAGVVLRSTDGRSFAAVPFPEPLDLSAVRADDANRATVTAADGRTLSTTDAGATWRPSLQDF